jgi:hypothetical protein
MTAIPFQREIVYPESDGEPMAETEIHLDETIYLIEALRERFRETPDAYVWGDMFLYFKQGDPRSVVSPDVFLVKGVAKRQRRVPLEADGSLISRTAGVTFRMEGSQIRLVETASGRPLPRSEEVRARNLVLEEENARLRAELERARKTD